MDNKRQPKGDTQKDIDESMRKSNVGKVVKEQAEILKRIRKDHRR